MAATVETKIVKALESRVATLPLSYSVIWADDEPALPPTAGGQPVPYIEGLHLPNRVVRLAIGSTASNERPGILQLTLLWPIADIGDGEGKAHRHEVRNVAGQIAAHFPTDLAMDFDGVRVRVERAPDVDRSYRDETYLRTPVSIRYRSFI